MRKPYRLIDGKEARDYQMRAAAKIFTGAGDGDERDGTATIIDMGLGKTFIALQAIADLFQWRRINRPVLIIAPILVAETVWRQEAAAWNTTNWLTFSLLRGNKAEREKALATGAHCYLINPELLGWLHDRINGDWSLFDMLVVDESSAFKSPTSKRWKLLADSSKERIIKDRATGKQLKDATGRLVRQHAHRFKRVVILTGTPAPTSLLNLWPQVYLLDQGKRLHTTFQTYRDRYFYKEGQVADHVYRYGIGEDEFEVRPDWMPKDGAPIKIHELMADLTVELNAADYGILPATIGDASKGDVPPTHKHLIELPPDIRELYDAMERDALIELGKDFIMAVNGGAKSLLCEQISSGFVYRTDEYGQQHTEHLHNLRLDKMEEVLDSINANTLLLYHFVADRLRIIERLTAHKRPFAVLSKKEGKEVIEHWNKGQIPLMLLHPQSASHGLNLQDGGHNLLWYAPQWSNERYQQTNARLARSGQTGVVGIHHIVANKTVDELKLLMYRTRGDNQTRFRQALRAYQALRGWGIETRGLGDVL